MKRTAFLMIVVVALTAWSCSKKNDSNSGGNGTKSTLNIRLTDAPGTYDAVNVDITSVGVRVDSTWYDFNLASPGIYNLINLSNGNSTLLVSDVSVPAGTITQMRLHLGDNNTIVVDGVSHDLKTPSGQTSGYKVKMTAPVEPGVTYVVLLDFDAQKSIVKEGNGNYLLKPVVSGSLMADIGQIDGTVVPPAGGNFASAWNATDTFDVFIDQQTGFFLITSLVPGPYTVKITANPPYHDTTFMNVPVTVGQVTHLDTIALHQ